MKYGLEYNRPTRRQPFPFEDSSETIEIFTQRKNENREEMAANRRLNDISKQVREEIDTRLWATMYLQYLIKRIHTTALVHIDFSDLPNLENLSLSDETPSPSPRGELIQQPFEDLSLDLQIQILNRRLLDACIGTEAIWATLKELVGKLTSEISEHPPDSSIAFRVFDDHSQARYFSKGDIRCGNWQEFNVNEPLTRLGAENHIRGARISTNYISISTSPLRLWNFVGQHMSTTQKIAVIDLRVLQRLGIAYGSTTDDLGFRNIGDNRTEYATKHHILVAGWIPNRSILGFLSRESFNELLKEAQIDTPGGTGEIQLIGYDRKIPFNLIWRHLE